MLQIKTNNNTIEIYTPFNRDFTDELKNAIGGRKWDSSKKCWTAPLSSVYADTEDELWDNLDDEVSSCIYAENFIPTEEIKNFCEEFDSDYWEWLYDCGKRIHPRVYLWADGFYRACNQLGF